MEMFEWSDSYSVGIGIIDVQHKALFSLIEKFHETTFSENGKVKQTDILDELIVYTKKHFREEEKLLESYSYPDISSHIGEHQKLEDRVVDFKQRFVDGELVAVAEISIFLMDWLKDHIKGTDMLYSIFLKEKGVM